MYKKILKNITNNSKLKKQAIDSLYKTEGNSVTNRQPHFIFSAENPIYPENVKYKMSHNDVMDLLQRKGYKAEAVKSMYGNPEKSIIVHNPSQLAAKHLLDLSKDLGQESSIYSDGYNHEMHYHGGPNAGKHVKGQGTTIHKRPPNDFYTSMNDGTTFTHLLDMDHMHEPKDSMLKQRPVGMSKSEGSNRIILVKNDEISHPLETSTPDTKLINYSPTPNLTEIDPRHQGVRRIGGESKQGKPEHPTSFYYLEGTKPESIVTGGVQSKYVTSLGNKKLYDIGADPAGIKKQLKTASLNRQINPGSFTRDELDAAIKGQGYHGIYNSSLDDTMKNVVAMYHPMQVEQEIKFHPKDLESANTRDFHKEDEHLKGAKEYAKQNGHHDGSFLHNLSRKLGE